MSLNTKIKAFISLVVLMMLVYSFAVNNRYFYLMAKNRHLSDDMLALKKAEELLPKNSFIYIDKSSLNPANVFADTRWYPYIFKNQRFAFNGSYTSGGYIYDVMTLEDIPDNSDIYTIKYNNKDFDKNRSAVVFKNKSYSVTRLDRLYRLQVKGLYAEEAWGTWMSDEITVRSNSACDINVTVLGKFYGIPSDSTLIVKSSAGEVQYKIDDQKINIQSQTKNKEDVLIFKSSASPVSPSSISDSADTRKLSFMIGDIYASNCVLP